MHRVGCVCVGVGVCVCARTSVFMAGYGLVQL